MEQLDKKYQLHYFFYTEADDETEGNSIYVYLRAYKQMIVFRYLAENYDGAHLTTFNDVLAILRENNDWEKEYECVNGLVRQFATQVDPLCHDLPLDDPVGLEDYLYVDTHAFNVLPDEDDKSAWKAVYEGLDTVKTASRGFIVDQDYRNDSLAWTTQYNSNQVTIAADDICADGHPCLRPPGKAFLKGVEEDCFVKLFEAEPSEYKATEEELLKYRQIHEAISRGDLPADMRISRMKGVVVDSDIDDWSENRLVAMLLDFIPNKGTLKRAAWRSSTTDHMRRKWASDLDKMVATLHEAGIVWGDVHPGNVIVDEHNELWIVDFGGGFIYGWIDDEMQDSTEGDLQGVARIRDWLKEISITMDPANESDIDYAWDPWAPPTQSEEGQNEDEEGTYPLGIGR